MPGRKTIEWNVCVIYGDLLYLLCWVYLLIDIFFLPSIKEYFPEKCVNPPLLVQTHSNIGSSC